MRRVFLIAAFVLGFTALAEAQQVPPGIQTINEADECKTWTLPAGAYSVTAQVTGTFSGTITFRGSSDGLTYFDIALTNLATEVVATTTTTTGQYAMANAGLVKVRACMTAYTSGGANIGLTRGYGMVRGGGGSNPSFQTVTVNPGPVTVTSNSLGTTSFRGFLGQNTTAAAAGAQQYSPMTCWKGQGWKTDATAASQSVEFCLETQPVQGTSAPTGNFILKASINGGAFSTVGAWTSAGAYSFPLGTTLAEDGANAVVQRNGSNRQDFRVGPVGDYITLIGLGGSGVIRTSVGEMRLGSGGTDRWSISTAGHYVALGATYVKTGATTVGALPTCDAAAQGARLTVTDANATTFLSTVAAGGANIVPVMCNGTNWVIG